MRVASRRLRVALPVLSRKERGRIVRRCRAVLRLLIRTAGPARDLDVIWALFGQEAASHGRRGGHWSVLRRRLRDARHRSHGRLAQDLLDLDVARLRRDLRALLTRSVEGDVAIVNTRLALSFERERGRCVQELERLGRSLDLGALHALRRRIRRLRYLAELREELGRREPRASSSLRDLQDRLGHLRDTALLVCWLDEQASRSRRRRARAMARVASSHAALFRSAIERLHTDFLDQEPLKAVSRVAGRFSADGRATASYEDKGATGPAAESDDRDPTHSARRRPGLRPASLRTNKRERPKLDA